MAGRLSHAMCLLAVAMLAASAQAAQNARATAPTPSSSSFTDWLGAAPKVSTMAAPADYYQEVESIEACLKEVAYKNCRTINSDGSYFESAVSCCKGGARGRQDSLLGPDEVEIGTCEFEEAWFDTPIQVTAAATKWGRFQATCTLRSAAHLCGFPFCDQMMLVAEGNIYQTEGVVSPVDPASVVPLVDDACLYGSRNSGSGSGSNAPKVPTNKHKAALIKLKGSKQARAPTKVSTASTADGATASTAKYTGDSGRQYYTGTAVIYSGAMSIVSRKYDVKMTNGWFEYVWDMSTTGTIDEADAVDSYMVNPYSYTLKFTKPTGAPDSD